MLKKPNIIFPTFGGLPTLVAPYGYWQDTTLGWHSSAAPPPKRTRGQGRWPKRTQWRGFADVRSDTTKSGTHDDLQWPDLPSATAMPTPYQIFKQKKGAPYSKRRFYELCKIYHPDRNVHQESLSPGCLSHAIRLERYRLIIAANEILSDPQKRSAYDSFGAGWNGMPVFRGSNESWTNTSTNGWSGFDHNSSPARNATWEDWEKWYQRDTKGKQEPLHFSNGGFVALIVIIGMLGGMGEITRMGNYSRTFIEQIEAKHDESSKDLMRRRRESQSFNGKDERVQSFLRTRDPIGYGLANAREEAYRKLLPAPEVRMGGDFQERATSRAPKAS